LLLAIIQRFANKGRTTYARSGLASILRRAAIAVFTRRRIECRVTTGCAVTSIIRAYIAIITNERRAAFAFSIHTRISGRACIAIVASSGDVRVAASAARQANFRRTHVVVIAIIRSAGLAYPCQTGIANRTNIPVFTWSTIDDFRRFDSDAIAIGFVQRIGQNRCCMRHRSGQDAHRRMEFDRECRYRIAR
jgi:hypothetical protein